MTTQIYYINKDRKVTKCSECKFLNTWHKTNFKHNCIGHCAKLEEFCGFEDGCTFGEKKMGLFNLDFNCGGGR